MSYNRLYNDKCKVNKDLKETVNHNDYTFFQNKYKNPCNQTNSCELSLQDRVVIETRLKSIEIPTTKCDVYDCEPDDKTCKLKHVKPLVIPKKDFMPIHVLDRDILYR